jgi:hypothetical protein
VQINDDGTHAILPVAKHLSCNLDHAGVPVMWLRHADGKLRRDGIPAALLQRPHAVDERGRVHGAPGLAVVVTHRVQAWRRGPCRKRERKREWVRSSERHARLRRQDKANWRSRTRRSSAIEKPLPAHWFLATRRLALRPRLAQAGWRLSSFPSNFNTPADGARGPRFEGLHILFRSRARGCDFMRSIHRGSCVGRKR